MWICGPCNIRIIHVDVVLFLCLECFSYLTCITICMRTMLFMCMYSYLMWVQCFLNVCIQMLLLFVIRTSITRILLESEWIIFHKLGSFVPLRTLVYRKTDFMKFFLFETKIDTFYKREKRGKRGGIDHSQESSGTPNDFCIAALIFIEQSKFAYVHPKLCRTFNNYIYTPKILY